MEREARTAENRCPKCGAEVLWNWSESGPFPPMKTFETLLSAIEAGEPGRYCFCKFERVNEGILSAAGVDAKLKELGYGVEVDML